MKEIVKNPIEGHFKIEAIKDGKVVDVFEDKNQIMFDSKKVMLSAISGAQFPSGLTPPNPPAFNLNTFVLGTQGHKGSDYLTPEEIDYTLEDIYSVNETTDPKPYPITFNPSFITQTTTQMVVADTVQEDYHNLGAVAGTKNTVVTMKLEEPATTRSVVYTFDIPKAGGLDGSGGPVAYTEAGFYTVLGQDISDNTVPGPATLPEYGHIFAMRTFPAKIKDDSTTFRITWRIIF